jgi:hypothetical protein
MFHVKHQKIKTREDVSSECVGIVPRETILFLSPIGSFNFLNFSGENHGL